MEVIIDSRSVLEEEEQEPGSLRHIDLTSVTSEGCARGGTGPLQQGQPQAPAEPHQPSAGGRSAPAETRSCSPFSLRRVRSAEGTSCADLPHVKANLRKRERAAVPVRPSRAAKERRSWLQRWSTARACLGWRRMAVSLQDVGSRGPGGRRGSCLWAAQLCLGVHGAAERAAGGDGVGRRPRQRFHQPCKCERRR